MDEEEEVILGGSLLFISFQDYPGTGGGPVSRVYPVPGCTRPQVYRVIRSYRVLGRPGTRICPGTPGTLVYGVLAHQGLGYTGSRVYLRPG